MAMPSADAVARHLIEVRRSLRGTEWDGAALDHFVQILCRLDAGRHGFAVADLGAVEGASPSAADEAWSGGLVARLKDGRRVHLDGRAGAAHWSDDADLDAGWLESGESHPEIGARHGWQGHAWDDKLARMLNEFIGRLAA